MLLICMVFGEKERGMVIIETLRLPVSGAPLQGMSAAFRVSISVPSWQVLYIGFI